MLPKRQGAFEMLNLSNFFLLKCFLALNTLLVKEKHKTHRNKQITLSAMEAIMYITIEL